MALRHVGKVAPFAKLGRTMLAPSLSVPANGCLLSFPVISDRWHGVIFGDGFWKREGLPARLPLESRTPPVGRIAPPPEINSFAMLLPSAITMASEMLASLLGVLDNKRQSCDLRRGLVRARGSRLSFSKLVQRWPAMIESSL
jgi:hypothetical protein